MTGKPNNQSVDCRSFIETVAAIAVAALERHSDASGPGCDRIIVRHTIAQQMDKRNEHIRVDMHQGKQERI